jgi:hypothetical protein
MLGSPVALKTASTLCSALTGLCMAIVELTRPARSVALRRHVSKIEHRPMAVNEACGSRRLVGLGRG